MVKEHCLDNFSYCFFLPALIVLKAVISEADQIV